MATIVSMISCTAPTGSRTIVGAVKHEETGDAETKFGFTGSAYGAPGPVVFFCGPDPKDQFFVDDPGRFGESFDHEWVRKFFAS